MLRHPNLDLDVDHQAPDVEAHHPDTLDVDPLHPDTLDVDLQALDVET